MLFLLCSALFLAGKSLFDLLFLCLCSYSHPINLFSCPVQDAEGKQREKAERLRFGRFFYRFPNGESG